MTQRNPRMQSPPVLVWAGLALLLIGALLGTPPTFTGQAVKTFLMVAGQLLLLGTMLFEGRRAGRVTPPVLMILVVVLIASTSLQLWTLWDAWHAELMDRQRGL